MREPSRRPVLQGCGLLLASAGITFLAVEAGYRILDPCPFVGP